MSRGIIAVALLFVGCSTSPLYYERQPWAQKGHDQASAECYTEIQQDGGPRNYYQCMRAKGWFEVYNRCRPGFQCVGPR